MQMTVGSFLFMFSIPYATRSHFNIPIWKYRRFTKFDAQENLTKTVNNISVHTLSKDLDRSRDMSMSSC